ncbi:MAG: GNAT family N-acetyltransferase [bacterium]|nr:GNAT family N-acetyltransferase [bacterium]
MDYKRCTPKDMDLVYEAFKESFADYLIKFDIEKDPFIKRFFGPEGNSLKHSFVALDNDKPVGIVLGGIKNYEGLKTMRCGGMGIIPSYRGRGVSKELFDRHRADALLNGCKQLFLEVIKKNLMGRALSKRMGYKVIYDLHYLDLENLDTLKKADTSEFEIKAVDTAVLRKVRNRLKGLHLNWQNDIEYIRKSENQFTCGIEVKDKTAAVISINKSGKLNFLWVDSRYRGRGMATALLAHCAQTMEIKKISSGFSNNASVEFFLYHHGFKKDKLEQYEMYLPL